jgi:hypothetical protein
MTSGQLFNQLQFPYHKECCEALESNSINVNLQSKFFSLSALVWYGLSPHKFMLSLSLHWNGVESCQGLTRQLRSWGIQPPEGIAIVPMNVGCSKDSLALSHCSLLPMCLLPLFVLPLVVELPQPLSRSWVDPGTIPSNLQNCKPNNLLFINDPPSGRQ